MKNRKFNKFLFITCLLFMTSNSFWSNEVIKRISNIDGLSNNSVNCILEDSTNTLWIGTWDGLNAYNGSSIKTYRFIQGDSLAISNNIIRNIIQKDKNSLWISTDFGVNKWDYKKEKFTQYYLGTEERGAANESAYIIQKDLEGNLFCYVSNVGFHKYNAKTDHFDKLEVAFDQHLYDFIIKQNIIYFYFKNKTVGHIAIRELYNKMGSINLSFISSFHGLDRLLNTSDGLVALFNNYFVFYDTSTSKEMKIHYPDTDGISSISRKGNIIYMATDDGLKEYNIENESAKLTHFELKGVRLSYVFQGEQDLLWIGSDGQGIFQKYSDYSSFDGQQTPYPVRAFSQYEESSILVASKGGGLDLFDRKKQKLEKFADMKNGLLSNSVYCLAKTSDGDILVGSDGNGLNYIHKGDNKIRTVNTPIKYPFLKSVYALHFSNNYSTLWIGTAGNGLLKGELKKNNGSYYLTNLVQFATSEEGSSINNNIIYTIEEDNAGRIWFGTRGGGVYIVDNEITRPMKEIYPTIQLTNNDILSLYYHNESMWIGTSYGLNYLELNKKENFAIYTTANGLKNNTIHGMLKANDGGIWISTNDGLSKLYQNSLTNYTTNEGLQSNEFSDGSYFQSTNGELYFGGVNGFNYFAPSQIRFRSYTPDLELSALSIYNIPQAINEIVRDGILHLTYNERFINLSFIAKEFIDNSSCEYAYRIKHKSDEWISLGTSPHITFSNLTPGNHLLEVRSTNGDKIWNNNIYKLSIQVAYPWWLSAPAIVVYVLIILIIAYITHLIIRNRIRLNRHLFIEQLERKMQQETHEQKLDFFTNVAHEFFTPLTLIYTPAQYLIDNIQMSTDTKRYVHIIKNNAERLQTLISELMEFRKAKSGHTTLYPDTIDLDFLIDYIIDNYTDVLDENKIIFSISKQNLGTIYTDKNSLEKVLINLISNAYKYTPRGGYIEITMSQDEKRNFYFKIRNSGSGLTQDKIENIFNKFEIYNAPTIKGSKSTGIGLHLSKSLIELLGGSISVTSQVGQYTQFEFVIKPLSADHELNVAQYSKEVKKETIEELPFYRATENTKKIKVLLVEDEKNIRELVKDILSAYYNVIEAVDGLDAYEQLANEHPDLIITDIMMPNINGRQLIKTLKSDPLTSYIPIVGISAKNSIEDHISAYNEGADIYLSKPFHPSHLLSVVNNILKKQDKLKEYFNSPISSEKLVDGLRMHNEEASFLKKIVDYIYNNIDDDQLGADAISNYLTISKATLYRILRDINNQTPSELIRSIRLEYAAKMLSTTQMTVSEIIIKSGFSNRSYFYKEFAKKYGSTPSEYRNKS